MHYAREPVRDAVHACPPTISAYKSEINLLTAQHVLLIYTTLRNSGSPSIIFSVNSFTPLVYGPEDMTTSSSSRWTHRPASLAPRSRVGPTCIIPVAAAPAPIGGQQGFRVSNTRLSGRLTVLKPLKHAHPHEVTTSL